ncbi:kelch-like protein 40 [Arctopsyche grandis]|uniref:kelch-like protein 40 n=1 Tax=Arctopsyche grandis TaxID=121162 RepID=UPI00406D9D79
MFIVKAKSDFAAKRVEYLYDAMRRDKKCDTSFFVRGRYFYVHLVVLSAYSEFFGRNIDKLSETFSPFDFDVIDAILKYCYAGEISPSKDERHYDKLMELANRLEVKIPPRYETVDLSNCLDVLKSKEDYELKTEAMDLENFETLHKTQDFLNLPASNVIEILKSNYMNVPSKESAFNAVKLWVIFDNANRKKELVQLMRSVRLSLVSMEFFIDEILTFCHACAECMTALRQAIKDKNDKSFVQRETPRRKIKGEKMALVGGYHLDVSFISQMASTIDIFDGLNNSWTLSKNIGINKHRFASVLVEDRIVIIGGRNSLKESVEYIDLKSGQKHPLKPLNHARCDFSAVTLRRGSSTDVYAIGGSGKYLKILSSVERWNSKTGDWEIIAPLLVAVDWHSASVIDDNIYVTGGFTREYRTTNKVQMYSVETNSWTYRTQMIQSVVFIGKLYVAGGVIWLTLTYLDSVEHYDPNANVWTAFTKLPKPAFGISLCCFQNKLFSMGIHGVKKINKGGIAVTCNKGDIEKFTKEAEQKMGEDYTIKINVLNVLGTTTRLRCGSCEHIMSECKEMPKCTNCEKTNIRLGMNLSMDHDPFDRECTIVNVQGFTSHKDEIENLIVCEKPWFLGLSETHVTSEIEDFELGMKGYNVIRCDSNSRHTGRILDNWCGCNYKWDTCIFTCCISFTKWKECKIYQIFI